MRQLPGWPDDIDRIVDELNDVVVANPGKFFSWEWGQLMTGLTYDEWMGWDRDHRTRFVLGLRKLAGIQ
jgi:hypothetical protein